MNRSITEAALSLTLCALVASPLLTAQQPMQVASISLSSQLPPAANAPQADATQLSAVAERDRALKSARTLHICSETMFLTTGALDRALMKEKNWDKLGLNIVSNPGRADLELQVNRVIFTHVHTYILTEKSTGIVLASGKVTAFDGVIASGPMAEQIVKILSAARLNSHATTSSGGF